MLLITLLGQEKLVLRNHKHTANDDYVLLAANIPSEFSHEGIEVMSGADFVSTI